MPHASASLGSAPEFSLYGVKALGYATDLIFPHLQGKVEMHPGYICVRTPENPNYMWGNFLLFNGAPRPEDVKAWPETYRRHFGSDAWFCTLGWAEGEIPAAVVAEFEAAGFSLETAQIFVSDAPSAPARPNSELVVRALAPDEWNLALRNHIRFLCHGEFALEQKKFEEFRFASYRRLAECGVGNWYGAFVGEKLVGDMGIFVHEGVARFQEVLTHFDYRRQGVCRTLCHRACQLAAAQFGATRFVTLASEPDAMSAYRSIGFQEVGVSQGLRWYNLNGRKP